jgi:16S rRNA (guanine1207-N2)-methyltransferase
MRGERQKAGSMKYEVGSGGRGAERYVSQSAYRLPDGLVTIVRWPGVPEPSSAHEALFAAARRVDAERVFVTGPSATATALWAARTGARVAHWTENAAEALSLTASFAENQLAPPASFLQAGFDDLEPASCNAAFVHLPRGHVLQEELLRTASAMLRPGGRLVFVGAKNEGVHGAVENARAIFGQAGIVTRKGGYHAGLAQRPDGSCPLPDVQRTEVEVEVDGTSTHLVSYTGAFAAGRLDEGAASLIKGMRLAAGARVLDLGCGTGLVGLAALRRGVDVTLSDVSARAVASTCATLTANGYSDAPVHLACGAAAEETATFDCVLANPPFHRGHGIDFDVSQFFVAEAARVLKAGGRLYLVANAFLRYEAWLRACFGSIQTVWEDKRFRVWEAVK